MGPPLQLGRAVPQTDGVCPHSCRPGMSEWAHVLQKNPVLIFHFEAVADSRAAAPDAGHTTAPRVSGCMSRQQSDCALTKSATAPPNAMQQSLSFRDAVGCGESKSAICHRLAATQGERKASKMHASPMAFPFYLGKIEL